MISDPVVCKYSNALLLRWILGEVEMIGAKTCPEFVDLAVWQVARGMKNVELKGTEMAEGVKRRKRGTGKQRLHNPCAPSAVLA
jgi:hypothetical protein